VAAGMSMQGKGWLPHYKYATWNQYVAFISLLSLQAVTMVKQRKSAKIISLRKKMLKIVKVLGGSRMFGLFL
jgi:hypothetical protein